ncbi:NAD(P)-binding domain-containing protein [Nocardia sp. NBC_01503]|uniref:NAD(P)-dependent oxidoreductase n=1 Tax=Nocardia sp. NBC_01503 TaxID=2975997 RepID=UPI002E7B03A0|nr:NAD(P)-binding domain-containing protein [Nocardia sp. NBC_01503]WTL31352.1 NAD(P)-binding domain-containing protein [Nocardia sp. NBC_01503]
MSHTQTPVIVLGLGAMGRALAAAFVKAGVPTTVWNRSAGKDIDLVAAGAVRAASVAEAIGGDGLVISVLLDHASVHEQLDPVAGRLAGRRWLNLTSTAPEESRELAVWAREHDIEFLDGGIMAVPPMIGEDGSAIFYSGSRSLFDTHRGVLELLGSAEYFGADAGAAALNDFALLSSMYQMFVGFFHGAAMAGTGGMSATAFAQRAVPFLSAMVQGLPAYGQVIDSGEYAAQIQHLAFQQAALDAIVRASRDAGIATDTLEPIAALVGRQVEAGHGGLAFARFIEELRRAPVVATEPEVRH